MRRKQRIQQQRTQQQQQKLLRQKCSMRYIALTLAAVCTTSLLTGCQSANNNNTQATTSDTITLLDPITASGNTERAAYRSLYQYQTYTGTVYPGISEYSFPEDVSFGTFEAFPGQGVSRGDVIAAADNTATSEQIESTEEYLEQLTETYEEQMETANRQITAKQEALEATREWAAIAIGDAERIGRDIAERELELSSMIRDREEKTQLYELDYEYYSNRLEAMKREQLQETIRASEAGIIVALGNYAEGNSVSADRPVIALADTSQKIVKCSYMAQSKVDDMKRVYVMVGGVKYEATYIPYAQGEYGNLLARGETAYSYFAIDDPNGQVEFGSVAVIVMIEEEEIECLSVPKSTIHTDEGGDYVYSVQDGNNVKKYVETGFSDGVYVQILEGITEEEYILLTDYRTYGEETCVLEMGSFANTFSSNGYLAYPDYTLVSSELEYGEVSFVEYAVEQYSVVTRGDVIARVTVEADEILLQEKNMRLTRQRERLQDLQDELAERQRELSVEERIGLEKQITDKQEQITEMEEEILEMQRCYATTELYANTDGIVIWRAEKQNGDSVREGEGLMYIATQDTCYLEVNNENQILSYGNVLKVEFTDINGTQTTVDATVVSVSQGALSDQLTAGYAYLQLPAEAIAQMAPTESINANRWSRKSYDVSGTPRKMENVLLVPSRAVHTEGGHTYVYVVDENGEKSARSFIAGGFDAANYWVVEGLEEGMTLCLE